MNFNNPKKLQSRIDTIVTPYKKNIGGCLPPDRQYWTMCANCTIAGCELDQMTSLFFITPKQFMGVDIDLDTIEVNRNMKTEASFIHGDFFDVMASCRNFNPGVVNMDCLRTGETEKRNIKRVFMLLQKYSNILLNVNVLLGNYHVKDRNPDDMVKFICEDHDMVTLMVNGWKKKISTYIYKGLGATTKMMSIGLIRNDSRK